MVKANIVQTLDVLMIIVNVGRALKMRRQEILYIAVDNKDADYFLIKLFNKIHNKTPIVQFNRKTFILETET